MNGVLKCLLWAVYIVVAYVVLEALFGAIIISINF
jgi:hypothetical protein